MKNSIKCLIVDDEPLALELVKKHIAQMPNLELVGACWNAIEAFEILKKEPVDLIFLDIQMPVLNGIEFVKSLKNPPKIIFTTAYRDYAVESYELDVIDYLLKPITFNRFFQSIDKYMAQVDQKITNSTAKDSTPETADNFIYVNTNRRFVRVIFKEILYIESLKDYIRIHTADQSIFTKEKISVFEQKLPSDFIRVHRSFIVNSQKVTAFTAHDIEIQEHEIPIGISFKKEVLSFFKKR